MAELLLKLALNTNQQSIYYLIYVPCSSQIREHVYAFYITKYMNNNMLFEYLFLPLNHRFGSIIIMLFTFHIFIYIYFIMQKENKSTSQ